MEHAAATPAVRLVGRDTLPRALAAIGTCTLVQDRAAFEALAPEWDALVARSGDDQLFYRHWFLSLWLDHFASDARLRVATLRDRGGRLTAVLPLLWRRQRVYGLPVRTLCALGNLHSCRFDLVAEDPARAAPALLARLLEDRDWDLLQLPDVPPGGRAHALLDAAAAASLRQGTWDSIVSPFVRLPPDWERFHRGLGSKARAALRRRRGKLAALGELTLERVGGGPRLQACVEEALAIEASGWKGRAGSAIQDDPATLGFYTALAAAAAERGALALWMLRLDGRAVAFQFALEHRERGLLLKQGYDEAFRSAGPGQLLMEDVLREGVHRGMVEFDLLGDDSPAKRTWTDHARQHQWLYVFRGARGRLLHALKFGLAPRLRRLRARLRRS